MLHAIISIIGILLTIFFVIGSHELAHFVVARALGVKVLRFSIGFGKTLRRWHDKSGTEYVLALIPLGGYVKMLDSTEEKVDAKDIFQAFNNQPFYKKFLIIAAGPLANIFCALILYWLIFMIGFSTIKPVIGNVTPHSIAATAGLKPQMEIIETDNINTYDWSSMIMRLLMHIGNRDQIAITTRDTHNVVTNHILDLRSWKLDGLHPEPLTSIGLTPWMPALPLVVGEISADSPAVLAGFELHDKILAIGKTPMTSWEEMIPIIKDHPDESLVFTIERNKQTITLPVLIGHQYNLLGKKSGFLGIGPHIEWPNEYKREISFGPLAAFQHAARELWLFTSFNFILIGKIVTGKLSLQSLGGPITIFDTAGNALNSGLISFLGFLAFLSISIGVINLLPIPGLDGGHLFLQTIEFIMRRPVPEKWMKTLYQLGFLLVFFLIFFSLMNDILRMFQS